MDDLEEFAELTKNATANPRVYSTNEVVEPPIYGSDGSDKKSKNTDASMWAVSNRDYFPTEAAVDILEAGQYVVNKSQTHGFYFTKRDINLDNLLVLPDSNAVKVLEHIEYFWNNEKSFREYGFVWKRGILLWGPPGSGKTSLVQQISQQIVDMNGITVYCVSPHHTTQGLELLRRIEPNRPIVIILEDIDAIVQEYGESELLAMLDGELSIDNVVFIATTNYPDRLDKRFINRPSRFDEIIKIGMPTPEAREFFLVNKNPRLDSEPRELANWVDSTEGFSVAHLKELIISVECFGKTKDESVKRLRTMMEATANSYSIDNKGKLGFT